MVYFDFLRGSLPAFFPAPHLDKLTNGILCWRTIQNNRSRFPPECFVRISTRKILIVRDPFLDACSSLLIKN